MRRWPLPAAWCVALVATACADDTADIADRLAQYATVRLSADLSGLSEQQRRMIPVLIDAAREMDAIFWDEAYGARDSLLAALDDPLLRRYVEINYGPWDRLAGNAPFVEGVGPKPAGANFYPADMSTEEFEQFIAANPGVADRFRSLYTLIRRADDGTLTSVPYHEAFAERTARAATRLREAAALADDPGLRTYLTLRAEALLADDYRASDLAWLDMKNNALDVVIGPIETYEDQLFGYKASHEAYVLLKDREWSARLARYAQYLPALQRGLPVPSDYRRETPGTDADLGAYDAIYYAGEANAGSKTIAINLPNDEAVQLARGTRRLQLKNAMRAKFDSILLPIAGQLLEPGQREGVTFDAFFANVMFHEVAHGLGIKQTINGRGTVREALREHASTFEEAKADILGLYMLSELHEEGVLGDVDIRTNYVTFVASIFRSVRFGTTSAHGRANMLIFNRLRADGVIRRNDEGAQYRVALDRFADAMLELCRLILTVQGDGDYDRAAQLLAEFGRIDATLASDLARLGAAGIPVDIVFEQGPSVLD